MTVNGMTAKGMIDVGMTNSRMADAGMTDDEREQCRSL